LESPSPNENIAYSYTSKNQSAPDATFAYGLLVNSDSPYSQRLASQAAGTIVYSSDLGGKVQPEDKKIGNIADYDPINGAASNENAKVETQNTQQKSATKASQPQNQNSAPGKSEAGFTVRALYDYTAADKDEVSFTENDVIVNCQMVDEGWMTGTVSKTQMWGMLPANYVEKVNQPTGKFKIK